jgi:ribosomal protein S18 acetylase RimI-like enzyme
MDTVSIRKMRNDEVELCADVIRNGFATVANEFGLTLENCPTNGAFMSAERLKSEIKKGNFMYVLCEGDKITGFMELEKINENRVELQKITVLPAYRHNGYGKKMLDFARKQASELGGSCLTIGIIEENTVLKEWYVKNGFVHSGTRVFDHLPFTVGFLYLDLTDGAL